MHIVVLSCCLSLFYFSLRYYPRFQILELISYLKRIFKDLLETSDWMDKLTRDRALEKVYHVSIYDLLECVRMLFTNLLFMLRVYSIMNNTWHFVWAVVMGNSFPGSIWVILSLPVSV